MFCWSKLLSSIFMRAQKHHIYTYVKNVLNCSAAFCAQMRRAFCAQIRSRIFILCTGTYGKFEKSQKVLHKLQIIIKITCIIGVANPMWLNITVCAFVRAAAQRSPRNIIDDSNSRRCPNTYNLLLYSYL